MENKKISSKCTSCGSDLVYSPRLGCLVCKHCDSNYFLPTKDSSAVLVRQYSSAFHPNTLSNGLNAYRCTNCGNVQYIASDESTKRCANCGGNSTALDGAEAGYCADGIIPFKITKDQAAENFKKYLKRKILVPKELKNYAENQKLLGTYVPVWNFSLNVSAGYSASVTNVKKDSEGAFYSISKPIFGEKFKHIKSLDECASKAEDDVILDLFNENDYADIVPYTKEYTYGYRVDNVDRNIHEFYQKIVSRAENELEQEIKQSLYSQYREISNINVNARAEDVFFNFTYVPVYINTFKRKNKVYKTYISGTTGKVIGTSPKSIWFYLLGFGAFLLALGAVGAIIYTLLH